VTTPHIPVQFWILLVIGSIALAPATYIYRYTTHSPSRQEIGKPPENLSWRSPETYGLCLLALIALAGLAIFIFTPTAADFARSWIFAPAVLAGLAILATYQVIRGLRTGAEEPMIRGFYTSYNSSTQPKRYWASIMWNSALGLMMGAGAIAALWAGAANAGQDECFNTKGDYSPKDALTACNRLIQKHPSNDSRLPDTLMARGNAYYELRDWNMLSATTASLYSCVAIRRMFSKIEGWHTSKSVLGRKRLLTSATHFDCTRRRRYIFVGPMLMKERFEIRAGRSKI
jgi:hypothetical protein